MTGIVVRAAAAADVEDAYRWYESQRSGLGEDFLQEVRTALSALQEHPKRFPVVRRDTRRALLKRFPYGLFYRLYPDQIVLVACMHSRRDPRRWKVRR